MHISMRNKLLLYFCSDALQIRFQQCRTVIILTIKKYPEYYKSC